MRLKILGFAALALALAGCAENMGEPINEEIFVETPGNTAAPAPNPSVSTDPLDATEPGFDPALELVEDDPYGLVEEAGADGLAERLPDTCKLESYQQYRGRTEAEIGAAGLTAPYRVVAPDAIVTQEYNPVRVNFFLDRGGKVGRISCG